MSNVYTDIVVRSMLCQICYRLASIPLPDREWPPFARRSNVSNLARYLFPADRGPSADVPRPAAQCTGFLGKLDRNPVYLTEGMPHSGESDLAVPGCKTPLAEWPSECHEEVGVRVLRTGMRAKLRRVQHAGLHRGRAAVDRPGGGRQRHLDDGRELRCRAGPLAAERIKNGVRRGWRGRHAGCAAAG